VEGRSLPDEALMPRLPDSPLLFGRPTRCDLGGAAGTSPGYVPATTDMNDTPHRPSWSAHRRATLLVIGALSLALSPAVSPVVSISPPAAAGAATTSPVDATPFYVALGGSAAVGVQPTPADPHGEPTDRGYADDLVITARSRWPGLQLRRFGCPGESTATMISGGGHCQYPEGSQLSAAEAFLHGHPDTRLITVDLGFNDIRSCFDHHTVDETCVDRRLNLVENQMPTILSALKRAAPTDALIIGVGHDDPFVAAGGDGPSDAAFAVDTLRVIQRLDQVLRSVYAGDGIPMADVLVAFDGADASPQSGDRIATGVVERVCALTWMCADSPYGPNLHPDDAGYRVMAQAIAAAAGLDR
jgi:lysophospholipase L1-like esterase